MRNKPITGKIYGGLFHTMLRRYRHIGLAIGIILLVLSGSVQSAQNDSGPHSKGKAKAKPESSPPPVSAQPRAYQYPYPCEKPKSAEQDSLCIQRRATNAAVDSANWAEATFYVGIAGTVAVLLTLVANFIATVAAYRSAEAAKDGSKSSDFSLRLSMRPAFHYGLVDMVVQGPGVAKGKILITNDGYLDAKIIACSIGMAVMRPDSVFPNPAGSMTQENKTILLENPSAPGQMVPKTDVAGTEMFWWNFKSPTLTEENLNDIADGTCKLYAFGRFCYRFSIADKTFERHNLFTYSYDGKKWTLETDQAFYYGWKLA